MKFNLKNKKVQGIFMNIVNLIHDKYLLVSFCPYLFIMLLLILNFFSNSVNIFSYSLDTINTNRFTYWYDEFRLNNVIDSIVSTMTLEQKIGQSFIFGINGPNLDDETKSFLDRTNPGGIYLTKTNLWNIEQSQALTADLQTYSNIPLFIATDQEGGSVWRVWWDSAYSISQPHVGVVNREDFAYETAKQHGEALILAGINTNFSPVLDINTFGNSFMAYRSFDTNKDIVALMGKTFIISYKDIRIMSTAKHFPGHGRTTTDSHYELPVINITKDELYAEELVPFIESIRVDVPFIMTSHVIYPQIDSSYPASLSYGITTNLLRNELGYKNIVITDDMKMEALNDYPDKIPLSYQAGNDMILTSNNYDTEIDFFEQLLIAFGNSEFSEERLNNSLERILRIKCEYRILNQCK